MTDFIEIRLTKQAELIDKLNGHIKNLQRENDILIRRNFDLSLPAKYYTQLTRVIDENPILRDDWVKFMTLVKLACDEDDLKALK